MAFIKDVALINSVQKRIYAVHCFVSMTTLDQNCKGWLVPSHIECEPWIETPMSYIVLYSLAPAIVIRKAIFF